MQTSPDTHHPSPLSAIRIGTRASKLALRQAEIVREQLMAANPNTAFTITPMTTAGDRELHKTLADWGYKGLFTRELEDALLNRTVDIAVHSMKDMPSMLPKGLAIGAMLQREDTRDAWISAHHASIAELPHGATVGTSSVRRAAQLRHKRPDVNIVALRGNVQTRLQKLADGAAVATFLAAAGLNRLQLGHCIRSYIEPEEMLPATAQGAIGIEYREDRAEIAALLAPLNHTETHTCITAERAFLLTLDGSCHTPIGGLAVLRNGEVFMRGEVLSLDGALRYTAELSGSASDAAQIGTELGKILRSKAGESLLQQAQR